MPEATQDRKVRQFSLSPAFLAEFEGRQPQWGPVGYFTYKRTYARPTCNCEDPRSCGHSSEEFWETCRRVVEGVYNVQKMHCRHLSLPWNEPKAQASAHDMFRRMWDFKWTPPGRGLWMMGTPFMLQKGGACINNCFAPETKAWVQQGGFEGPWLATLGELAEFSGGERVITVLAGDGQMRPATARSFGVQKLVKVSFAPTGLRSNYRLEYDVTPNHRWILADGVETTALKVGDRVKITPTGYFGSDDQAEIEGFAHGLVFGDGARHTYYADRHQIRLCGEKEQVHLARLEQSGFHFNTTHPESYNGDALVWFKLNDGMNWKALPPENSTAAYQRAFLQGWLAADGTSKPAGTLCLYTQNPEAAQWVIERAPLLGFCVTGFNYDPVMETNYGPRSAPMARITLTTETTEYTVKSITDEGREDEVFCVTEPETGTFTLDGGLVTGNCAFVSSEHIDEDFAGPFCFLMDMSMLGVGVGGDTRGVGKVKLQTPKLGDPFIVADSREGWVALARAVLNSFVGKGTFPSLIDFSAIRPKGKRIRGFGGTASGAGPLTKLVKNVTRTLLPAWVQVVFEESVSPETGEVTLLQAFFSGEGKPYRIGTSQITDVFNMVGACVVAGGVRRSAEILFGQPDDTEFRTLKDPSTLWPLDQRMAAIQADLSMTSDAATVARLQAEAADLEVQINAHPLRTHRWASNNSIFGEVGMEYAEVAGSIAKNGEPGILWLKNAQDYGRMKDPPNFKDRRAQGANPCVTGDTIIFTTHGPKRADKMLGKPFRALVDGKHYECKTGVFQTGVKPVYLLQTKEGHSIRVTADHQILTASKVTPKKRYEAWVEAQDLTPGDKVILNNVRTCDERVPLVWDGMGTFEQGWVFGNLLGDGHFKADQETGVLQFWGDTKDEMLALALQRIETLGGDPRYHQQRTGSSVDDRDMVSAKTRQAWLMAPEFGISHTKDIINDTVLTASLDFQKGFLRGLFDADGSVQGDQQKGVSVRLGLANRQHLAIAQKMLMNFGINSTIYDNRREAGAHLLPDGKGGQSMYDCEAMHDLVVSNDNIRVFADRVGFDEPERKAKLAALLDSYKRGLNRDRFVAEVESVNYVGIEPVFDCTVDEVHRFGANGITVHNCSEQTLESYELCVGGNTRLTTRMGAPCIKDVVGKTVEVWNGVQWSSVTPFITGQNRKLYRVHLSDGSYLDCTDNHKWEVLPEGKRAFREVETKDLTLGAQVMPFDIKLPCGGAELPFAYEWGFFTGDGYLDNEQVMSKLHGAADRKLEGILRARIYKEQHPEGYAEPFVRVNFTGFFRETFPDDYLYRARFLNSKITGLPDWLFSMDRESTLRFIAGWIDADGTLNKQVNTDNYTVYGTEAKIRDLQMLLRRVGVNHASVYLNAEAGQEVVINGHPTVRNHDLWACLIPSYEGDEISRFCHLKVAQRFGSRFATNNAHPEGAPIDRARKQKIVDIEELPDEYTTYCFDEPERHMAVFNNVLTHQCTLVETYPAHHDTYEDFQKTLKVAYLYAKAVTLIPTHDPRTNAVMNRNRRIGCSMSGIRQAIDKFGRREFLNWCDRGYNYIQNLDRIYSEWLGIPLSIKTTSVKPSGTVSLLCGATPGIHPPHAPFYIRNIRVAGTSPLCQAARDAGYKVEKDAYVDDTWVISFPVATHCTKGKRDVSIWEQAALAADMQRHWADNQVSVTVTFKAEEAAEIGTVLEVFEDRLKSVSFLPLGDDHGYVQAPYIEITEDEYNAMAARIRPMVMDVVKTEAEDKFCDGAACEIDFSKARGA